MRVFSNWLLMRVIMPSEAMNDRRLRTWGSGGGSGVVGLGWAVGRICLSGVCRVGGIGLLCRLFDRQAGPVGEGARRVDERLWTVHGGGAGASSVEERRGRGHLWGLDPVWLR